MTIYKDVNGREFTYNEYWNKVYLDEKRPHVDHLIRHKWPEEKPTHGKEYLVYSKDEEYGWAAYIIAEWKDYLTADEFSGPYGDIWEKDNSGWYHYSDDLYLISVYEVECYWNLPEVTE